MNPQETIALVRIVAVAHDRDVPDGLAEIWHATLNDLPFGTARQAVVELLQTSPYMPRPADIRERARLIDQQAQREAAKRRQLEDRQRHAITAATTTPAAARRTGANMVRHVLGRLRDAGQNPAEGHLLGVDRAKAIAEAACQEWLDRTADQPATPPPYAGEETACAQCYAPHQQPPGTVCATCAAEPVEIGARRG